MNRDLAKLRGWQDRSRKPLPRDQGLAPTGQIRRKPMGRQERRALERSAKRVTTQPSNDFSPAVRALVADRSRGVCEMPKCWRQAVHMHHRRLKGRRGYVPGTELASNAAHLCAQHHAEAHDHPTVARKQYGVILRSHEDPAAVPFRSRHGLVLLGNDGSVAPVSEDSAQPCGEPIAEQAVVADEVEVEQGWRSSGRVTDTVAGASANQPAATPTQAGAA